MDEKELKELLLEKLHIELHLFKDSMLCKTKAEIYESSYKIEVFVNVYEILMEEVGSLDIGTVRGLLCQDTNILESLYREWLTRDDGGFDELKEYVGDGLGVIALAGSRKEAENGAEPDQAA